MNRRDELIETVGLAWLRAYGDPDNESLSRREKRAAQAAILATLEGIREATPEMYAAAYEAGAIPVDKLKRILHNMTGGTYSPAPQLAWQAMLDTLIASVKARIMDKDRGGRDFVNEFFRAHYPPDWNTAWETDHCAGSYGRRYKGAYKETHDTVFPRMVCADGLKLSVQGHFGAYSHPRGDFESEYSQVEIMGPPDIPEFAGLPIDGLYDGEAIYPYVSVALVNKIIAGRGGIAHPTPPNSETDHG